ncbi:MAG: T9SS type A sorting domain-containing protein [Ginsengibacter sp.]
MKSKIIFPAIYLSLLCLLVTNKTVARQKYNPEANNQAQMRQRQQEARVIITDLSGRVPTSAKQVLSPGVNTLSYSSSAWAKGIYLINIQTSAKFNGTLKALK